MAIADGKLSFTEKEINKAAYKLIKTLSKKNSQFATIIYGADVTDQLAEQLYATVSSKLDHLEVNMINGGQPVYYYIVSVE